MPDKAALVFMKAQTRATLKKTTITRHHPLAACFASDNAWPRAVLLALALSLVPACKSPLQLYETRSENMRESNAPRLQVFPVNEQPAIVVDLPKGCGWGQKTGTIWVEDVISGRTVWSQSQFMREGEAHYFIPPTLASSTYLVTLRAAGEIEANSNFDVR